MLDDYVERIDTRRQPALEPTNTRLAGYHWVPTHSSAAGTDVRTWSRVSANLRAAGLPGADRFIAMGERITVRRAGSV